MASILVIDDHAAVLETVKVVLAKQGHEIRTAPNGKAGMAYVARKNFDLIITDIIMPEVNGRQLAEAALQRLPHIKLLFTTGYAPNATVHNGVLDPNTPQLHKPFTLDQLAAKVREALDS